MDKFSIMAKALKSRKGKKLPGGDPMKKVNKKAHKFNKEIIKGK